MQALGAVTADQLASAVQAPKGKFEIYYGGAWIDITNLGGLNYLKSFTLSLGGATMTPDPVAGQWSATIDNADGIFHPAHPTSAYRNYFTTGTKVRISIGGHYGAVGSGIVFSGISLVGIAAADGGTDTYWARLVGVMDSPRFTLTPSPEVQIQGFDYMEYLSNYRMKRPVNYWGSVATISTVAPVVTVGAEMFAGADALTIGAGEANTVASWATGGVITISSVADVGGGSTWVMKCLFGAAAPTNITYAAAGTFSWTCPAGITSVDVQAWGGGGGGGGSNNGYGAGAGGGGGYSKKLAIPVVPGNIYLVVVGSGGAGGGGGVSGQAGQDTYFIDITTVLAKGGGGGINAGGTRAGGAGGASASGVGDTKYSGGAGGAGSTGT